MSSPDLALALRTFTRSAWRLEARDVYSVAAEADAFAAWQAGDPLPPRADGWLELIAPHIEAGRSVGRVHAITTPPSDYIRFEIAAAYEGNVAAGEEVRIADRGQHPLLAEDFWIFDDRRVIVLHYDDEGRFTGRSDGTHKLAHYRRLRDCAIDVSVPLHDWTPSLAK